MLANFFAHCIWANSKFLEAPRSFDKLGCDGSPVTGLQLRQVTDRTTGETISHLTNPAKDAGQVIGYSHSTRRANDTRQVAGYGEQPIAGAVAWQPLSHHNQRLGQRFLMA
jgi:hypothetical protein